MDPIPSPRRLDDASTDEEQLLAWIKEGEHQQQDFKFRIDSSVKIARTLAAFANTGGGRLLIGVKDDGRVAGVDPEEEFYMIEGAADIYCKPPVAFDGKVYETDGKLILVVNVYNSPNKPHLARNDDKQWRTYIRQNDENFVANKVVSNFLRERGPQSNKKDLVAYGDLERTLFEILDEKGETSVSAFRKRAQIPMWKAEKVLVLFLKWGLITYRVSDKGVRFYPTEP